MPPLSRLSTRPTPPFPHPTLLRPLFAPSGAVNLLTLFDFRDLPAGKLRVRQFDIPETNCSSIGRVLFNDIDSCAGAGCDGGLKAISRVKEIEVLG